MPHRLTQVPPPAADEPATAEQRAYAAELQRELGERAAERRVLIEGFNQLQQQMAELVVRDKETTRRLVEAERRMNVIGDGLDANNALTAEIRDLLAAFKGGFKVLEWLGLIVKWGGIVAGAGTAIYTAIYMATHGGHPPGRG